MRTRIPNGQTFDNDPLNELRPGGGIRYITPGHSDGNRNARVTKRLQETLAGGDVSFSEMTSIQADQKLNDAEVLTPYITAALRAAQTPGAPPALAALGADPKVQEAVARLAAWQFSTPTGIPEGFDATDPFGLRLPPTQAEIDASVATTIYSLWRGRALAAIVDGPLQARGLGSFLPGGDQAMTALRHLLETGGTGASGIVFFAGPIGRDTAVLGALKSALDLAASPAFAPAFGGSTNLADYRWGKLHRIVFRHPLGGPFSIPTGAGFTDLGRGPAGHRHRRRLQRRRRLVAQPARVDPERVHVRQRAGAALRRRGAAHASEGRAGDPGRRERQPGRAVVRQPARPLADERLPRGHDAPRRDRRGAATEVRPGFVGANSGPACSCGPGRCTGPPGAVPATASVPKAVAAATIAARAR